MAADVMVWMSQKKDIKSKQTQQFRNSTVQRMRAYKKLRRLHSRVKLVLLAGVIEMTPLPV